MTNSYEALLARTYTTRTVDAAHAIFPSLRARAIQNRVDSYGPVFREAGLPESWLRNAGRTLDVISILCEQMNVPDLAALCVSKKDGMPGDRYRRREAWAEEVQKVHSFDWSQVTSLQGTLRVKL
jgi:hypothetical protein